MEKQFKLPQTIWWVLNIFVTFLILFTVFRITTYFAFKTSEYSFGELIPVFWLGMRFDIRWISIILLPIVLLGGFSQLSPFTSGRNKKWWSGYLVVATFIVFFFFAADFGSFSYNQTRLDAGAMNFVEDPGISLQMIWQTYPIFWMLTGLLLAVLAFRWLYYKSHWRVVSRTTSHIQTGVRPFIITALVLLWFIYGNLGMKPLVWKDSFAFKDSFKAYLALNPLQNFFATISFRKPTYDEVTAKDAFRTLAEVMQFAENDNLSYKRVVVPGSNALESKPNIVLVLCESFSMYKSTMSGNILNTTPYFDSLSHNGIFFEKCFSPHFSTARGLFALITGIPDVQMFKFSSRNPQALKHHTIINSFEDYDKMYFLGGSAEFNNFKGILENIDELKMFTEEDFDAPKFNVWGISDKDLFLAANKEFRQQKKPFFGIIQTANNHRPFMIPVQDTADFKTEILSEEALLQNGFDSNEEYNSFRYSDYCFRKFIEAAQQESYFHNTIFVFVGDHGVAGNATAVYPKPWTTYRLTDEHVPLLFYAPYLLKPDRRTETVSQIDVLPTIAGMLQQTYINSTLGRDLLQPQKQHDFAFITNTAGQIGIVNDSFYYMKNLNFPDEKLVYLRGQNTYTTNQKDSISKEMERLTVAFYETARYMLMNNH